MQATNKIQDSSPLRSAPARRPSSKSKEVRDPTEPQIPGPSGETHGTRKHPAHLTLEDITSDALQGFDPSSEIIDNQDSRVPEEPYGSDNDDGEFVPRPIDPKDGRRSLFSSDSDSESAGEGSRHNQSFVSSSSGDYSSIPGDEDLALDNEILDMASDLPDDTIGESNVNDLAPPAP